jgi:RimJ/RimL family protein N-acetyltransferase
METDYVILRDVIEADLSIFYEHQLDPEAVQMADFPSRDRDTFMAHWREIMLNQSNILKTILFNGQVAGNIVSWQYDGEYEVGYWLGKEYWGKGIATLALAEFLALIKMRPLFAHVVKHNAASRRVLEKSGFIIHGEEGDEIVLRHD